MGDFDLKKFLDESGISVQPSVDSGLHWDPVKRELVVSDQDIVKRKKIELEKQKQKEQNSDVDLTRLFARGTLLKTKSYFPLAYKTNKTGRLWTDSESFNKNQIDISENTYLTLLDEGFVKVGKISEETKVIDSNSAEDKKNLLKNAKVKNQSDVQKINDALNEPNKKTFENVQHNFELFRYIKCLTVAKNSNATNKEEKKPTTIFLLFNKHTDKISAEKYLFDIIYQPDNSKEKLDKEVEVIDHSNVLFI